MFIMSITPDKAAHKTDLDADLCMGLSVCQLRVAQFCTIFRLIDKASDLTPKKKKQKKNPALLLMI